MRSDNFVMIQGWMCNELELKGNELLIFALIYGFSQDDCSTFNGGRQYIANTFNVSLPTVDKALQKLVKLNYVIKQSSDDYIHTDVYYVNMEVVKKLYQGSKETLPGGSKETLLNNIDNKKIKEKETISKDIVGNFKFGIKNHNGIKKDNLYTKCIKQIDEFTDNDMLRNDLKEFLKRCLENSRESNMPFYFNTFKGKLNSLKKLSDDNNTQRKIVLQTLDNGWNGFYELKENNKKGNVHDMLNESGATHVPKIKKEFMQEVNNGNGTKF